MKALREEQRKKELGQRGKDAEAEVKNYLTKLGNANATFDWNRQYDARTAGGRFPAQPGDFQYFRASLNGGSREYPITVNGLIEVKETANPTKLDRKNFGKDVQHAASKIARLRKRELAGTKIHIIVHHTATGGWREVPFSVFRDAPAATSWDLAGWRTWNTLKELFHNDDALRYYGD